MNTDNQSQTKNTPLVHGQSLVCGTLVSTDLSRVRNMLENAFGMECVQPSAGILYARDRGFEKGGNKAGGSYWVLEVKQTEVISVAQELINHWGMAAPSQDAVDEAYTVLKENKATYGLARVQKPRHRHGSYSFYFSDVDSNWWEIEHRPPEVTYETLRAKGDLYSD